MDYEKAYNEAIERAKQFMSEHPTRAEADLMVALFPELKESEDERTRKEIIEFIRSQIEDGNSVGWDRWIAYLEKQKINTEGDFGRGYDCGYEACLNSHGAEWFEKQKEPHYTKRNALFDKCVENCDPKVMKEVSDKVDEMLQKEQKPAEWSEDDEEMLEYVIDDVNDAKQLFATKDAIELCDKEIAWLKSLRSRPKSTDNWKPSEEHLSALLAVFNDPNNIGSQTCQLALTDLYEQLKKL